MTNKWVCKVTNILLFQTEVFLLPYSRVYKLKHHRINSFWGCVVGREQRNCPFTFIEGKRSAVTRWGPFDSRWSSYKGVKGQMEKTKTKTEKHILHGRISEELSHLRIRKA